MLTEELVLNVDVMLGVPNQARPGILNTVLDQDSAAPVGTAPDNLRRDGALFPPGLGFQRRQRMQMILAHGIHRALDAYQRLIVSLAATQFQPVDSRIALVLVTLDMVPAQHKVLGNIIDTVADDAHGHVMPGHARKLGLVHLILPPVLHGLEVHDAIVVEVLAREDLVVNAAGMHIRQRVVVRVPPAKTEVQAADKRQRVVDDDEFLVMSL